jgi:hypothetical protein
MPETTPAETLRSAAAHMCEHHGPEHVRHGFWTALAGLLNERAADYDAMTGGPYGAAGAAFAAGAAGGDEDPALMVARLYLGETGG